MLSLLRNFLSRNFKRRELEKKGFLRSRIRLTQSRTIGTAIEKSKTLWFFIITAVWCVCVSILMFPFEEENIGFVENQRAASTVFAEFDFTYEDQEKTKAKKLALSEEETPVYRIDGQITESCLGYAADFFEKLAQKGSLKNNGVCKPETEKKNPEISGGFSPDSVKVLSLLLQSAEKRKLFIDELSFVLNRGIMNLEEQRADHNSMIRIIDEKNRLRRKTVRIAEIPSPRDAAEEISSSVSKKYSPENRKALQSSLSLALAGIIRGNLVYDADLTGQVKKKAADEVKPVLVVIKKGDVIIEKGKLIDKDSLCRFRTYNEEKEKKRNFLSFAKQFINCASICLLLMILNGIYLHHIHPEVVKSNQKIGIIATVVVLNILANFAFISLFKIIGGALNLSPLLVSAVLPLAMTSLILSVMIGLRVGLYAGLFVSLIAALQLNNSLHVLLSGMVVSTIAGFAVRHAPNHRSYFFRGILAASLTISFMEIMNLWSFSGRPELIFKAAVLGAATGVFVSALSMSVLFILEMIFQISTDMSLLLLCDYNHPLLKRLQLEAPGTYHHSLVVSTLAEHAAQEIGANPIRARVCALFHDIGKLTTPEYFIENNIGDEDKHGDLNPRMSSLVIMNHVKDGVDMAIKFKLRKIICDAIEQHHGTDLVRYFYRRAVDEGKLKDVAVEETDYRYSGPLPGEKEVAIVSLADSCEAASRTLEKPSPTKIDALVWEIFRERIKDGQLNDADITLEELTKIRLSFAKTLTTMMHGRISYPKGEQKDDDESDLFQTAKKISPSEKESVQ